MLKTEPFLVKMKPECDRNSDRKWPSDNLLKLEEAASVPDSLIIQSPPQVEWKGRRKPRKMSVNDGGSYRDVRSDT